MTTENPTALNLLSEIRPRDLPQPRQAAMALIQACTRADVTTDELAELACQDATLTAELLRVVNTPFFGLGREVTSVKRAVTVLGNRALRNLGLCLAVRDALRPDAISGLDPAHHWEDALRRATSARLLAKALGQDADECFTLGLLQDCGLLVMFMRWPERLEELPEILAADPDNRYALEQQHFGVTHDQVAAYLARQWGLPEEIAALLDQHHHCGTAAPEEIETRCRILYCADWLAAVYSVEDKTHVIDRCRKLLRKHFDFDSHTADQLLIAVPETVEEAAAALSLTIPQQSDFQDILREANLRLSEENLSYQELTWRLEQTLRERDQLAAELDREIEMAREIQRSLLPPPLDDALIVGVNVPARDLSGDFYDFFRLPDGKIFFNLGDVSGKGMNAALLMAKTTSLFRCLGKRIHDPAQLLTQINDEICETTIRGMFVTMIAGLYDPSRGTIRIANAGHPPALLFRGTKLRQSFGAQAPPLGIVPGMDFPAGEVSLDGGTLVIVSDGITEAKRIDGQALGVKGLVEMITTSESQAPRDRVERIVQQLRATPEALHDDMTILMVGNHHGQG
ncbi:MAG: HDOD domain-containing protein [Proteobacteria bacterium]|nr:MAG: HDOD domain-containing protein [Pseudomonadota bacterium]